MLVTEVTIPFLNKKLSSTIQLLKCALCLTCIKKRISEKSALQVYIERYLVSTDLSIRYIKQTLAMKINTIEENSYLRIADLPLRWDNFLLMGTSGFDRRVFC